ncbi:uncharacterized protein LOC127130933 [Lathyrus oleraceus]|uniref:uncharacterized protein LOC127130933 n=1 Tax=Pisum sativum TaxID=3888 RepID=UPI0021D078BB|nr:uncharacterized protein LOC127130933 [Pisum sativum]
MGQIAQQLASSSQAQGALPSESVTNPREHNNVSVMTTRSGKSHEVLEEKAEDEDQLLEVDLEIKENEVVGEELVAPKQVVKEKVIEPKPVIKLPFPARNKKKGKHEKNFEKFLEFFKKLEINIPLLEALEQMPTYAKFMKDIISKRHTIDTNPIILTETCSAILQGMKIPTKKKDRGAVIIPCIIGDRSFKKALTDLGANVSLMPLSIYKKLGIRAVQDTMMTLQFADRQVKKPYGIVEDVLVKIEKFVFPVDFVILEMPKDEEIPLILGRPFLETGRCLINIEEGTMTLKVYDEELKIDVRNTMKYKDDIDTSHTIKVLDQVITYDSPLNAPQLPLERVLSLSIFYGDKEVDNGESEVLAMMNVQPPWKGFRPYRWEDLRLSQSCEENKESNKGTELKQLLENLKYVFLNYEAKPLTTLLVKDKTFVFDEECATTFETLKNKLVSAPIVISPYWSLPFEIMCDASDIAVGEVLGQRFYLWDDPFLYKRGVYGLARRCVSEEEQGDVLRAYHDSDYGGYFSGDRAAAKVL